MYRYFFPENEHNRIYFTSLLNKNIENEMNWCIHVILIFNVHQCVTNDLDCFVPWLISFLSVQLSSTTKWLLFHLSSKLAAISIPHYKFANIAFLNNWLRNPLLIGQKIPWNIYKISSVSRNCHTFHKNTELNSLCPCYCYFHC